MRIQGTAAQMPVPVLSIRVSREQLPTHGRPFEYTQTEVEHYFVTPEDAMAGRSARRLSFDEAIQLLIV